MDETPSSRVRSGGKKLRRYVGESRPFDSNDENLDRPTADGIMESRFWKRLHAEKKFSGPDELCTQIAKDIASAN